MFQFDTGFHRLHRLTWQSVEIANPTSSSSSLPARQIKINRGGLEITESSVMAESNGISTMLARLQEKGIKILVDDFGTGYSSLSQLHRLNFDVLKVDQSFTAAINDQIRAKSSSRPL
jgi:EAL domain-containing protein (putative c-di-GMP-specific phosphodiesterase class I)